MAHQLLLHAHGRTDRIEPRSIAVPESVPAHVVQSQLLSRRTDIVLLDVTGVVGPAAQVTGKDERRLRLFSFPFPREQDRGKVGLERQFVFRVRCFYPLGKGALPVVHFTGSIRNNVDVCFMTE